MYIAHTKDISVQTLEDHLKNVAERAKRNCEKIGMPLTGEIMGLLHDLGKYSDDFQNYILSCNRHDYGYDEEESEESNGKKRVIDHSTSGAQYIRRNIDAMPTALLSQMLSICIASHHAGLMDCISPDGRNKFFGRMQKDDSETHAIEVLEKCDRDILKKVEGIIKSESLTNEINKILETMPKNSSLCCYFSIGLLTRFLFSCLLDADRTDAADFDSPDTAKMRLNSKYPSWDKFIEKLEIRLSEFLIENRVDEIRNDISLACLGAGKKEQGIYTLTVPTGGGKTLASLRFALEHAKTHNLDRIFYIIPYTSIIDQNAREVQNIFGKLSEECGIELVLEHHSNLTPEKETIAQKQMAENWDAPIVFTTSVQFLDTLFNKGTRNARRMHNLAKSVIIFDEIQTLAVRMVHMFNNSLNFLVKTCASTVVLCTATQPLLHRVDESKGCVKLSDKSEIIPDVSTLFNDLKRVDVFDRLKPDGWNEDEIADLVGDELSKTGSVLVVVNTKKSAISLYRQCRQLDANVFHLSTNMCPQHRLKYIDEIKKLAHPKSNKPVICISTQLIEAGVDIDFGTVIRYIAGLDSVAQAAGRCNRSGKRTQKGRVIIINPNFENIVRLKEVMIGEAKTNRVIDDFNQNPEQFSESLLSPEALSRYFQYYFYERTSEMVYPVRPSENIVTDSLLNMLSINNIAVDNHKRREKSAPDIPMRQAFASAGKLFTVIDKSTQGIIVPYGDGIEIINRLCASKDIMKEKKLLRQAQRYSVNCYESTLKKLPANSLINIQNSGILYLKADYYSDEYGITEDPTNPLSDSGMFC